jgi:hypothetical protein
MDAAIPITRVDGPNMTLIFSHCQSAQEPITEPNGLSMRRDQPSTDSIRALPQGCFWVSFSDIRCLGRKSSDGLLRGDPTEIGKAMPRCLDRQAPNVHVGLC